MRKTTTSIAIIISSLVAASSAQAAIIFSNVTYGATQATQAETNYLTSLASYQQETFDNLATVTAAGATSLGAAQTGNQQSSWVMASEQFNTSVGVFSMVKSDGAANRSDVRPDLLMIENSSTGEFGRSPSHATNWLDSNDADIVSWDISGVGFFDSLGFYLSDVNDQGAALKLVFNDGTEHTTQLNSSLSNGNLMYVSLMADVAISSASLLFDNGTNKNDGWGIDTITVGSISVPEPATLALLSLGLIGVGAARRGVRQN
ncbi:PEP-CTERM sorting domain-containing protein [Saccharospirillum impatiens]|uniref:PEP-CTERM sorting domain-containing protein n=1 Tax=Saccharospirillum impatiens TaxID=169438 RepID=UPI000406CFBA|nr:PEP-CTERM sorting domain-containing protein [Saccharospirillum impatiens]